MRTLFWIFILSGTFGVYGQKLAVLKYQGGGDWYSNPTAIPNLISFCNRSIATNLDAKPETVSTGSKDLFMYPFVHMTGHGNVFFDEKDIENLRSYLLSGGFLHIDDNYGMRPYLERELKKLFPEKELQELPADHPIFHQVFDFKDGLPKIHEHDGLAPKALALFDQGRMILLFTFESDLGDGWENPEVHQDPEEVHLKALRMGANIISYVFSN
ncbi:DUF4159 domain-containing protein [Robertkochia solimangrovi]|uniref:DUF4159 domain-containing protein n=1 Tax=Robertkochia solimangrovi TaxID=2213046 RepID=UPI00117F821E|nr:DUF4159 domain-containing protein [Robertkochia solimangrovi]TRZ42509.1 hypothetical protein DMZ48_13485 [Robertkochia solimangrovi]